MGLKHKSHKKPKDYTDIKERSSKQGLTKYLAKKAYKSPKLEEMKDLSITVPLTAT